MPEDPKPPGKTGEGTIPAQPCYIALRNSGQTVCPNHARTCLKTFVLAACLFINSVVLLSAQDASQTTQGVAVQGALSLGDTATRTVEPGSTHHWSVSAASGQYFVAEVV